MRMDSLQKSFLPMWQEETLAKVSRKLDIIDEDDEQKVEERQEDFVLDRRTPQDAIGARQSLVRTHELGQLLGHANFFRGIHTAAIVLREACCFLCFWLKDSGNRQPAVFALHVK